MCAILAWTVVQRFSGTIRHSGTSTRLHSSLGRALLTLRPVSGFRAFSVRFHTCTPRYRSFLTAAEHKQAAGEGIGLEFLLAQPSQGIDALPAIHCFDRYQGCASAA